MADPNQPLKPFFNYNPKDTVLLLVGPNEEEALVHASHLSNRSTIFKTALSKDWKEGQTRAIKLPEDDPATVAQYLDFCYTTKLPTQRESTDDQVESMFTALARLYVYGERVLDSMIEGHSVRSFPPLEMSTFLKISTATAKTSRGGKTRSFLLVSVIHHQLIISAHKCYLSNASRSPLHPLAHQLATTMASHADLILTAASEALQAIGDFKWNIESTENAPPKLKDLHGPLESIRLRIGWLKEIKEEQWTTIWEPIPVHVRATLNAVTAICRDLDKSIWIKREDGEVSMLRIRVLTSQWKARRIFAHHMALFGCKHSLHIINSIAQSFRILDSHPPRDEIMRELSTREQYLRQFQDQSEERWWYLHSINNESMLQTLPRLDTLDKEDEEDSWGFTRFMPREIDLLRAAEDLAQKYRGRLKGLHDEINEKANGEKTCDPVGDCCYCSRIDECVQVFRRGPPQLDDGVKKSTSDGVDGGL